MVSTIIGVFDGQLGHRVAHEPFMGVLGFSGSPCVFADRVKPCLYLVFYVRT